MTDLDLDAIRKEWQDEPHDPQAPPTTDVICAVLALCDEVERLRAESAELRGDPVISDHDKALYYAETGRLPDD